MPMILRRSCRRCSNIAKASLPEGQMTITVAPSLGSLALTTRSMITQGIGQGCNPMGRHLFHPCLVLLMTGDTETLALHLVRALYDNLARCPSGWHEDTPHSHC